LSNVSKDVDAAAISSAEITPSPFVSSAFMIGGTG